MINLNTKQYLDDIKNTILENLEMINKNPTHLNIDKTFKKYEYKNVENKKDNENENENDKMDVEKDNENIDDNRFIDPEKVYSELNNIPYCESTSWYNTHNVNSK